MSLLIQKKPEFKSRQEAENYKKQKEEALQFWSSLKTVDMSGLIKDLKKDIEEIRQMLAVWE